MQEENGVGIIKGASGAAGRREGRGDGRGGAAEGRGGGRGGPYLVRAGRGPEGR